MLFRALALAEAGTIHWVATPKCIGILERHRFEGPEFLYYEKHNDLHHSTQQ